MKEDIELKELASIFEEKEPDTKEDIDEAVKPYLNLSKEEEPFDMDFEELSEEELKEAKRFFLKETATKLLKLSQLISLDSDADWLLEEIETDLGFKRLDKKGRILSDYKRLKLYLNKFRKECVDLWKRYNSLANKRK